MVLKRIHTGKRLAGLIIVWMGCCFPLTAIASDPYMDALNAEADSVTVDPKTEQKKPDYINQAPVTGGWSNQNQSMRQDLPANLDQDDFEEALKRNFYGSYMFYSHLDQTEQAEVFRFYQNTPSIEPLRQRIMDLKKNR
jgi:hypothetical protein